jgi:transposase-like protein
VVVERTTTPRDQTPRRFEIFTGAGWWRAWSTEAKARIVAESHAPGATACGAARQHGLSPQQLLAWRSEARRRAVEAMHDVLVRWAGLTRYLDDGRIEIDSNTVERATRPIASGRKNHLFAGSGGSGEHWAVRASLIETCKLNGIDPEVYLADVLTRLISRNPMRRIDELLT